MALFQVGNLWDELNQADAIFVTTNSAINRNGQLVMGRGAAREAAKRFPELPSYLANTLKLLHPPTKSGRIYGLAFPSPEIRHGRTRIAAFQVKTFWGALASVALIENSCEQLCSWLALNQTLRVVLNYPGIGNGGLTPRDVLPLIQTLPDQVTIYMTQSFMINRNVDQLNTTCLYCGMTSYSPGDVENRYCGACHLFHDDAHAQRSTS